MKLRDLTPDEKDRLLRFLAGYYASRLDAGAISSLTVQFARFKHRSIPRIDDEDGTIYFNP